MSSLDPATDAVRLLKRLTEAHGVPGAEDGVRRVFCEELAGCGPVETDRLGSTVCRLEGPAGTPRVLLASHFDEVGFAIQQITPRGFLKVVALGGWWTHTLVAQRVRILTRSGREIIGVVGSTPPHFLGESAKDKVLPLDKLYLDVGATSRQQVVDELGIHPGDPVAPFSEFTAMAVEGLYMAKAFDNRCGVAAAVQALQWAHARAEQGHALPCTLMAAGSVQEEVGCRGAQTLGALTNPDVAIVLEGTPADDTHGMPADEAQGALGQGVQIRVLDPSAIMNRKLVQFVLDTAAAEGIPHQLAVRRSGGTDAKSLQFAGTGVPCVVLGTPARYIHSHNSLIQLSDYLSTVALCRALVQRLDAGTVAGFTQWV